MILGLLSAGLSAMVLGLNLMRIHFTLKLTTNNPIEIQKKLIVVNSVVFGVGILIIIIGALSTIWVGFQQSVIYSTGVNVALMGASGIIATIGRPNLKSIYVAAWTSILIGILLIILAVILAV
jgi:hypothetical protein